MTGGTGGDVRRVVHIYRAERATWWRWPEWT